MKISAADVKALRELTNAGMMDCKKALLESQGDIEKAKILLQEKGKSEADSKSGRVASQGLVSIKIDEKYYGEKIVNKEKATELLKNCDSINLVGNEIISLSVSLGIGSLEGIKKINDIPFLIVFKV